MTQIFNLTRNHIKLVSNFFILWEDDYSGYPIVSPKRPYGNSNVIDDVLDILEWESDKKEEALAIHKETAKALQVILATQRFIPGHYINIDKYKQLDWKPLAVFSHLDKFQRLEFLNPFFEALHENIHQYKIHLTLHSAEEEQKAKEELVKYLQSADLMDVLDNHDVIDTIIRHEEPFIEGTDEGVKYDIAILQGLALKYTPFFTIKKRKQ